MGGNCPPHPRAQPWLSSDTTSATTCDTTSATGWHRDGGNRDTVILWLPIISDQPIHQYPLVFADPRKLKGVRPEEYPLCYRLDNHSKQVDLVTWYGMSLGDYVVFDGQSAFHASGVVQGVNKRLPRTTV